MNNFFIVLTLFFTVGCTSNTVIHDYYGGGGDIRDDVDVEKMKTTAIYIGNDLLTASEHRVDAVRAAGASFSQTKCHNISVLEFDVTLDNTDFTYIALVTLNIKANDEYFMIERTAHARLERDREGAGKVIHKAVTTAIQKAYHDLNKFCL